MMCTLMQKDVLIEVVANALSVIDLRTDPNAADNDDQHFLSNLRDELYSTAPEEIDYQEKLNQIKKLKINTMIYLSMNITNRKSL